MDQIENISTTLNRVQVQEIATAAELHALLPLPAATQRVIRRTQESLKNILHGNDDRLALIVGPCSIHDAHAALEFAQRLMPLRSRYADALEIVMRVYFEKPRTTVGSTTRCSTAASASAKAWARRASYCSTSTAWACPPPPNFSI